MKALKFLTIVFLLFFSGCVNVTDDVPEAGAFAQVYFVPNNETFTLLDVYQAVYWHNPNTTNDLSSCFSYAISSFFDPTYNNDTYAPANSMKRFRNYGPKNVSEYTNGASGTWTVPSGISTIVVALHGGGGAGGGGSTSGVNRGGGGGGGGAYARVQFNVTAGGSCPYRSATVAYGGLNDGENGDYSQFTTNAGDYVIAGGGLRGRSYANGSSAGSGGVVSTSGLFSTLRGYSGGNGANGTSTYSGGGGGGASDKATGNSASTTTGGAYSAIEGGQGGNGTSSTSASGTGGGEYGGGGGGGTHEGSGGTGYHGFVRIYW